jgi:hypothetical protein
VVFQECIQSITQTLYGDATNTSCQVTQLLYRGWSLLDLREEVMLTKVQFIKLLKEKDQSMEGDLCLRLVFCEYLAACTYTTLARAEDATDQCVSH